MSKGLKGSRRIARDGVGRRRDRTGTMATMLLPEYIGDQVDDYCQGEWYTLVGSRTGMVWEVMGWARKRRDGTGWGTDVIPRMAQDPGCSLTLAEDHREVWALSTHRPRSIARPEDWDRRRQILTGMYRQLIILLDRDSPLNLCHTSYSRYRFLAEEDRHTPVALRL